MMKRDVEKYVRKYGELKDMFLNVYCTQTAAHE
jgi:hypothetical protein